MIAFVLATVLAFCHQGNAIPLEVKNEFGNAENLTDYLAYMRNYGYLQQPSDQGDTLLRVIDIDSGLRRLQRYGQIPQTGQFDEATVALMKKVRCGVPDPVGVGQDGDALGGALEKRYAHTGGTWETTTLSYRILNYAGSGLITRDQTIGAIRRAFKEWSDVTPLIFDEKTEGFADIYIKFGPGYHGDPYPFDGYGGTLAHAYPPMSGFGDLDGDVHFDDAEPYTDNDDETKINLFIVAAHEIGHALGLAHSDVAGALMLPFYQPYRTDWTLPYDDQLGIQLLYGPPEQPPAGNPTVTAKPAGPMTTPSAGACNSLAFNAISLIRGELFAFKGARYWRIRTLKQLITPMDGDETKYFWKELPNEIDAAYERNYDQRIIFFTGDQYYEYDGVSIMSGFPKRITELDPNLPSNIDAVLSYDEYKKTYFFKGNMVWRLDEATQTLDIGWPYTIEEVFPGVPADLGSAFRYKDGSTVFVKGSQYYKYNDPARSVEPGYPRGFGEDYLGCAPGQLSDKDGDGDSGATTRAPTLLGVVLGTLMVVFNLFL